MPSTILKLPQVLARTGLSRSQVYALIAAGAFPRQVRLACSAVGWLECEIESFIAEQVAQRDAERVGVATCAPTAPSAPTVSTLPGSTDGFARSQAREDWNRGGEEPVQ